MSPRGDLHAWPAQVAAGGCSIGNLARLVRVMEVPGQFHKRRPALAANLFDHDTRFWGRRPADGRPARFDNSGLFHGDAGQPIAELLGVIQADAGNDRHLGQADVRGIESATQADLDHGNIHAATHEV